MAVDKTKLKEDLQKVAEVGSNVLKTGASLAKSAAPVVGQVVNSGLDLVSALLGGKGSGSSTANYNTPYQQSQTVTDLQNQLNTTTKPVQQQSQFQDTLQQTMDQILNKEKFTYDVNADALYNQYKDQYVAAGKTAMQDTMGQAAAMTGGYGNSYAQAVSQQQYQGYLQQLNDKIPELYQLARDSYDRDLSNLYNQYGLLSDAEAKEYSRYRDEVADYYADRDYLTNRFINERDFDYGQWSDNRDFSYQQHRDNIADEQWREAFDRSVYESDRAYDRSVYESDRAYDRSVYESDRGYDYQVGRDAIEDQRYDQQWDYAVSRDAVADSQWQKEYDLAVQKANSSSATGNQGNGVIAGDTGDTGDPAPANILDGVPQSIIDTAASKTTNGEREKYLEAQVGKFITTEQLKAILAMQFDSSIAAQDFELVDDGGFNGAGGINNDAIVRYIVDYDDNLKPIYKQMNLAALYNKLQGEGMSKAEAKDYVIKLQKRLGVK